MRFLFSLLVLCTILVGTFAITLTDLGTNGTRVIGDATGNYFRVRVRGGYEGVVSVRVSGSRSVKLNTLCRFLPQRFMLGTSANPGTAIDGAASHSFSFNVSSDSFDWNDCFVLPEYTTTGSVLSNITLTSSVYDTDLRRILVDAGAFVFDGVTFNPATGNRIWAYFLATTKTPYSWAAALDGTPFHTDYNSRDGLSTANGLITGKTYRVRSTLPSIDFSGSVAVSLTTSYQVWPSAGSATVTLKALQPTFAYWKVQIPTAASNQVQNHNLNVKFTSGNANDRVQVYASALPTFSPLSSVRTDITPGPSGARVAIPACAVDTINSVVYVVVVYAPAGANSSAIESGSLSVSATVDYTSTPATPTAATSGTTLAVGTTYLLSNLVAGDVISVSGTGVSYRWGKPQLMTTDGTNCTGVANLPSGISVASSGFSTCDFDTIMSSAALQLVNGSAQGTITRTSPTTIPTNGQGVVGTVPSGDGTVYFSSASTQFPVAITVVPNTAAATFQQFNNAYTILNGARCATTSQTAFTINGETESLIVLGCPGEALKINGFSRAFTVKQVGTGTTVTRNVISSTSGNAHVFDLAPNVPLVVRFNIVGLQSVVFDANITYQADKVHIRKMNGGDFCTTQPSGWNSLPVTSFGAASTSVALGSETVVMASAIAARITITYTANSVSTPSESAPSIPYGCVAEPSLIPAACSAAIPGTTKIFNTPDYDKSALQSRIVDEIEHFSVLENLGATGACYNAFVKEACFLRVQRCNASNVLVNDACFEQCISRLTAAGCASTEPATPLHYCSLLPFCPVENPIPIATYVGPVVNRNQAPQAVNIPPVSTGAPTASGSAPQTAGAPVAAGAPTAAGAPVAAGAPRAPSASAPKATNSASAFKPALIISLAVAVVCLLF